VRKTVPVSAVSADAPAELTLSQLERQIQGWVLDGEIRQLSPRTLEERQSVTSKFLWFLKDRELPQCGTREIRAFLAYVGRGHDTPGGRWGNERMTKPVKPRTVHAYFRVLRALFRWMVEDGALPHSPMEGIRPPVVRADQIQPFSDAQVEALLAAAKRSAHPARNVALIYFMIDTGARASEICAARVRDLDLTGRKVKLFGKGGKERTGYLGKHATRALWTYLKDEPREDAAPLFLSERGTAAGEALTRMGLHHIIARLGEAARIDAVRCSAHTFRHYFAVSFLRGGGNTFTLKELLGHTTLEMTNKYVALAQADLEAQHRQFSPADRLKRK
jgi:site-specific recombinase XerD